MPLSSVVGAQSIVKPGVCTSTTRPASPYNGQVIYETDTAKTLVWNGSGWVYLATGTANPVGLELIKTQTIGSAVSSVTVSDVFSATYDNYKILISGGAGSTDGNIGLTLGSSATGYYSAGALWDYAGTINNVSNNNATSFSRAATLSTNAILADITLLNPFATARTGYNSFYMNASTGQYGGTLSGFHNVSTSYTAFTLTTAAGTMTGGTIRVYGYRNS
jgi:hypothetical protein